MSDPAPRPTLLPSHATPREIAHAAVDARLDERAAEAVRITALKDPWTCPVAYLPYLAWERSVDVWDRGWPEEVQRAAIAAAPLVHALKGTPAGIKAALAALRIGADLPEWWEQTPPAPPYTFEVLALARSRLYADGPVLDARLIRAVHDTVMRTKPLSRAFRLRVGVAMEASLGLAPAAAAVSRVAGTAAAVLPMPAARATLGLAPAAAAVSRVASIAAAVLPMPAARATLGLAPAAAARVRLTLSARVA